MATGAVVTPLSLARLVLAWATRLSATGEH
jgi:hypothetical protein